MVVFGVVKIEGAVGSINLPTMLLIYALMIISAQLRVGGFYTWVALKIVPYYTHPRLFLLITMLVSALLSALIANDIVCFAFTPILALSLIEAGLNPLPFLIGLAVSSNIGSAATIIGNPQNMLIGQTGHLGFAKFFFWCSPPSLFALFTSYLIILWIYRRKFYGQEKDIVERAEPGQSFNKWQTSKGISAILILTALFLSSIPRELSAIGVSVLLCNRNRYKNNIFAVRNRRNPSDVSIAADIVLLDSNRMIGKLPNMVLRWIIKSWRSSKLLMSGGRQKVENGYLLMNEWMSRLPDALR